MPAPGDSIARLLGDKVVVIVEPSQNYRASLRQFLANMRARKVRCFASAEEARKVLYQRDVGLFIVEWLMPGTNGLQFRKELRASLHAREIPFLLLSMENLEGDIVLASEVDVDGYLLKPFSYEEFAAKVVEVLRARRTPTPLEHALEAAEQALARKDTTTAAARFEEALRIKPESARARAGLARIALDALRLEEAEALAAQAREHNPEYLEPYRIALRLAQMRGDRVALIANARKLHEKSPENPKYTMILARAALEEGDLLASEQYFKMTIAVSPKLADAYKGLGAVYLGRGDFPRSRRYYLKALDLDGEDISVLNGLGTASVRAGLFKEGINYYLMALKLDARNAKVKFNLGHAYEKLGEFELAAHHLLGALSDDPGFEKARAALDRVRSKDAG